MKNLSTSDIKMGSVFLIDSPLNIEFNCRIEDNPLSNKTELIVIAFGLIVCSKAANVMIYTNSQWVITIHRLKSEKLGINQSPISHQSVKIKAHGNNENNKKVNKLAKLGMKKEILIIEDTLLLYNSTICWQDMLVERNSILMIKGIKDAQFIDEFLGLNRNEIYKQPELLELIDWKISLKLNCIDQHNTLFENHFLQSFRIKICCNELPTCVNLKKWKLNIYDES
ncbi:unnamed protein product [Rhizophagus irregularis]|nr:unnamed protein product [Rhizophagus irregularis]